MSCVVTFIVETAEKFVEIVVNSALVKLLN